MMIVYLYLDKHNPNLANRKSNGSLTDIQIHMPIKPVKTQDVEANVNKLYLELDISGSPLLNSIENEDLNNHISH